MGSAFKRFINRLNPIRDIGSESKILISAFGKHPGWDDHIDDIGLETDIFIKVKRLLYVQGIGGNIDAGNWDQLEQKQQAETFGHVFVWCLHQDIIVGRLWPSQDGKGRSRYPMVVCVQCSHLPLELPQYKQPTRMIIPRLSAALTILPMRDA